MSRNELIRSDTLSTRERQISVQHIHYTELHCARPGQQLADLHRGVLQAGRLPGGLYNLLLFSYTLLLVLLLLVLSLLLLSCAQCVTTWSGMLSPPACMPACVHAQVFHVIIDMFEVFACLFAHSFMDTYLQTHPTSIVRPC